MIHRQGGEPLIVVVWDAVAVTWCNEFVQIEAEKLNRFEIMTSHF